MNRLYSKFPIFLIAFILTTAIFAQYDGFNYKSVIYNNGVAVANQSVTLRFTYYNGATTLYQETFTPTTSSAGIVVVNMGQGTVVTGSFSGINFANPISYKVEVNIGSGYTNMGTYDFKAVPYAMKAQSANSLNSPLSINDLSDGKTDNSSLFLGSNTGFSDDGNNYNVGIGQNCMNNISSGFNNVAIGTGTMGSITSGGQNTALGSNSLFMNQSASGNTAIGYATMNANTSGQYNTALGYASLMNNDSGNYNVAIGNNAIKGNSSGHNNVALGTNAGFNNSTGSLNVFLGYNAGYNETGSSKLYIDNSSVANPLIYGDFNTNQITVNGGLSVKDGTQGVGKVFTSDANGQGSWQNTTSSHTVFLSPASVQPMSDATSISKSWASCYIGSANIATLIIPIELPVGATVTSITYYFYDNNDTTNIRFSVYSTTISTSSSGIFGQYTSNSSSTSVQEYTPTNGGFIIAADKVYSVIIDANGAAWPGNSTLSIRGVKLVYTY